MVCPHGQGEVVEPVRTKGVSFSRFWADVFYEGPLMSLRAHFHFYGFVPPVQKFEKYIQEKIPNNLSGCDDEKLRTPEATI